MWPPILRAVRVCVHVSLHRAVRPPCAAASVGRTDCGAFLCGPEAGERGRAGAAPLGSCSQLFDSYSYHLETHSNTSLNGLGDGVLQGAGGHIFPSFIEE